MKSIKQYRESLGIKQVEMAAAFGVAQSTVVKWESEKGYPPSKLLEDVANYLGCTIDDLYETKSNKEVHTNER